MITVACVKWGNKYTSQHVNSLARMIHEHSTFEYEFVCLTDRPNGVELRTKEFTSDEIEGWWAKMNLFADHGFHDKVLYFDLDVIIHRNIDCLVQDSDKSFVSIRDFHYPDVFNSSVMFWDRDAMRNLWDTYAQDPTKPREIHKGDQDYITELVKAGDDWSTYPDEWTWSWKWGDERTNKPVKQKQFHLTKESRVAVFHGRPNPWEIDMNEFNKTVYNNQKS